MSTHAASIIIAAITEQIATITNPRFLHERISATCVATTAATICCADGISPLGTVEVKTAGKVIAANTQ